MSIGPSEAAIFGSVVFPAGEAAVALPTAEELTAAEELVAVVVLAEAAPLMEVRLAPGETMSRRHWGTLASAERAGACVYVCWCVSGEGILAADAAKAVTRVYGL